MISTALTSATSAPSRTSIHSAKRSGSRWPSNGAHSPSSNRSRRSFFSGRMLRQRIHRAAVTVLFAAAILDAQVAVRWDARRPLAPYRQLTAARPAAVDTLRLLRAMGGEVVPSPVTVSKRMADYSQDNAPSFRGLARLAVESWMEADTAFPAVDFSAYDAFVLFHAGTGKDIDLVGLFGY